MINNLDPNKAHGYDKINICMLEICGDSTFRPLNTILKLICVRVNFPWNGKKANIVSIHKKGDK